MPPGKKPTQDALGPYRDKRDPRATTEPFAPPAKAGAQTRVGRFVVHLHDATRTHYDLRIEIGGALKSFAVPRGPSLDPTDKRLAVNTEDHPIEYLDFEDVIPDGNYGAGAMIAWDQGRVVYLEGTAEEGVARGKIDFELSGFKLRGRFGLIHTGARAKAATEKNHWLLVKKTDAFSRADDVTEEDPRSVLSGMTVQELAEREQISLALEGVAAELGAPEGDVDARELVPMLCAQSGAELSDPNRYYELKLDGVRIVADRHGDQVALRYRQGRAATASYPDIARAVRSLVCPRLVLDGEIVAFDAEGRPSFQRLAPRITAQRPREVARAIAEVPVVYLVFDILQIGSRDVRSLPLSTRKELLARAVPGRGLVRTLDHIEGQGDAIFALCQERHLEGVVAKRKSSAYRPGPVRGEDWVKIKCERDEDFVIVGWEEGRGVRKSLGAVVVASYEGDRLVARGKAGSGLSDRVVRDLSKQLAALEVDTPQYEGTVSARRGPLHYVQPELVASVRFGGWTDDGTIRFPVFRGLRPDIAPKDCRVAPPAGDDPPVTEVAAETQSGRVLVSNRNKVFWPEDGYTKGDLVDYYAAVAKVMVPFLADRPVVLVRYPDGIYGKSFYQWRAPRGTPDWIETLELRDEEDQEARGNKSVFLLNDADALVHIANLGAIPIHVLASRAQDLGCGDFFTIDFDIELSTFPVAVTLALALRELLDEAGLMGYAKTSGKTGLHVLIPVGPNVPFTVTKALAELFGRLIVNMHPELATMERRVSERGQRVYVDTGQTGRGRTIVAPYSVREVPGATVSTPLVWEELSAALDPKRFDLRSVPLRIEEQGDPMADMLSQRPDVARALARLEDRVRALG